MTKDCGQIIRGSIRYSSCSHSQIRSSEFSNSRELPHVSDKALGRMKTAHLSSCCQVQVSARCITCARAAIVHKWKCSLSKRISWTRIAVNCNWVIWIGVSHLDSRLSCGTCGQACNAICQNRIGNQPHKALQPKHESACRGPHAKRSVMPFAASHPKRLPQRREPSCCSATR